MEAGEGVQPAYCVLVLLVPLVGLGMYLQIARPKVKSIASAGRAASLPFESFGDDAIQAQREVSAPFGTVIAPPERFGSFGATTVADGEIRLVGSIGGPAGPDGGAGLIGAGGGTATAALYPHLPSPAAGQHPGPGGHGCLVLVLVVGVDRPPGMEGRPDRTASIPLLGGGQWTENVADNGEQSRDALTS